MLTNINDLGTAALEAAYLSDLAFEAELTRIEAAFAAITDKLQDLINQLN